MNSHSYWHRTGGCFANAIFLLLNQASQSIAFTCVLCDFYQFKIYLMQHFLKPYIFSHMCWAASLIRYCTEYVVLVVQHPLMLDLKKHCDCQTYLLKVPKDTETACWQSQKVKGSKEKR